MNERIEAIEMLSRKDAVDELLSFVLVYAEDESPTEKHRILWTACHALQSLGVTDDEMPDMLGGMFF